MRIAICTDQYVPMLSGIADSVAILKTQLQKNGHEVRLYTLSLKGAPEDPTVKRFPALRMPGSEGMTVVFPWGIVDDLREFKPDIIHTHLAGMIGLYALFAARKLRVPLVGTDHTFPAEYLHYIKLNFFPFPYLVRRFSAWYYNRCVFVTAPSNNMLTELTNYGFVRPSKVISNHIPTHVFRPLSHKEELKRKYGIGPSAVLVFGRIAIEKNLNTALTIFQQVASESATELVFVGDGPYRKSLESFVSKKSYGHRVRFLGALRGEQLVEAINACEVFLITSLSETQSMTTLQAMACGLPVVAIRAGGLPEYVHSDKNGYCIEPGNNGLCAEKILSLLANPAQAKQMGERGRESVAPYSPERITAEFEEVYERTTKGHFA